MHYKIKKYNIWSKYNNIYQIFSIGSKEIMHKIRRIKKADHCKKLEMPCFEISLHLKLIL